jgi:tetratricopeptide (TPR) repeat protein
LPKTIIPSPLSYELSVKIYKKIISLGKDESMIWNNWGWLYNSWGRYSEAIPKLQEFAKAIKDFEEVSIIGPSNAEAYFCSGLSLLGKGDYDNAITRFEKAFSNDQTYKMRIPRQIAAAYSNFGTQLRSEKKYEEAFQMFKKAYDLNPKGNIETKNLASAYYNQGILANTRKQYKEAEKYYHDAIQLDPYLAEA